MTDHGLPREIRSEGNDVGSAPLSLAQALLALPAARYMGWFLSSLRGGEGVA